MEGSKLDKVTSRRQLNGLRNLAGMECNRWIQTHRWLTNSLIYLFIFQFLILSNILTSPYKYYTQIGINQIYQLVPFFVPIGVIVMLGNEVIKEKEFGTLAWVLTNPVNRSSFVLAKFLVNIPWALVIIVGIEWVSCWLVFPIYNQILPPFEVYVALMGINMLYALFYITFTLMLGFFLKSRGAVIGIPMIVLLAQFWLEGQLVKSGLIKLLPQSLNNIMGSMISGFQVDFFPIAAVSVWCVIFVAGSMWRIKREQF